MHDPDKAIDIHVHPDEAVAIRPHPEHRATLVIGVAGRRRW